MWRTELKDRYDHLLFDAQREFSEMYDFYARAMLQDTLDKRLLQSEEDEAKMMARRALRDLASHHFRFTIPGLYHRFTCSEFSPKCAEIRAALKAVGSTFGVRYNLGNKGAGDTYVSYRKPQGK